MKIVRASYDGIFGGMDISFFGDAGFGFGIGFICCCCVWLFYVGIMVGRMIYF